MLRTAATKLRRATLAQAQAQQRSITSAQKRAIQKDQITPTTSSTKPTSTPKTAQPPTQTAAPPSASGSSASERGGGSIFPALIGLTAVGIGGAYYMDVIPNMSGVPVIGGLLSKDATGSDKEEQEQAKAAPKKEEKEEKPVEKTVLAKEAKKVDAPNAVAPTGGNRVLNITAPDNKGRKSDPIPTKGHAEGGNRVSVEKINGGPSSNQDVKTAVDVAVTAVVDAAAGAPSESKTSSAPSASLAAEAEKELSGASASAFAAEKSMIDEELAKAHALMKRTVDETYLKDLEELSTSALKIRVVQLASEMNERAKWEAVRLKEFLAMKEKEVGEK